MKREIIAIAVLIIIPISGFFNVRFINKTVESRIAEIDIAMLQMHSGDIEGAENMVENSLEKWSSKEGYMHIFLTYDLVKSATNAYYVLLAGIQSGETQSALFDAVRENLLEITKSERVRISSIF